MPCHRPPHVDRPPRTPLAPPDPDTRHGQLHPATPAQACQPPPRHSPASRPIPRHTPLAPAGAPCRSVRLPTHPPGRDQSRGRGPYAAARAGCPAAWTAPARPGAPLWLVRLARRDTDSRPGPQVVRPDLPPPCLGAAARGRLRARCGRGRHPPGRGQRAGPGRATGGAEERRGLEPATGGPGPQTRRRPDLRPRSPQHSTKPSPT